MARQRHLRNAPITEALIDIQVTPREGLTVAQLKSAVDALDFGYYVKNPISEGTFSYREALDKKHPAAVEEILIYGSKARGQAHPDSDLDVLLIVRDDATGLKRELRRIGYLLAATTEVLPSILAYTQGEWESRKQSGSSFRKAVERDAVRVA